MQNMSYEYIDEMSQRIVEASQNMMEEISSIDKSQFENEIELMEEVNRIKEKYANSLGLSEDELNKALENNKELYADDWRAYNLATGYGLSDAQDWIDSYRETTLGNLLGSESDLSNYVINFQDALDELTQSLRRAAGDYYSNIDAAFAAAGMTKAEFASYVAQNSQEIK
jgi:membrane-associated HD superfamily phosphohydrolase